MNEDPVNALSTKTGEKPKVIGPPKGNTNAIKHGVYFLTAARKRGKIDRRTSFGKAFEARKKIYLTDLGSDLSAMEDTIVEDTVWTDFYCASFDAYLSSLKSPIRKGRPHPLVDARTKLAAHRRENIKVLGTKRRVRQQTIEEILSEDPE